MSVTQPAGAITTIASGTYADVAFSSDGSKLYAVSGNTVAVIALATGTNVAQYTFGNSLGAIDVSLDGKYLAVVDEQPGSNGNVYRIDLTSGQVAGYTIVGGAALSDVAFLANGTIMVSQQATGPLDVVDLQTGDSFAAVASMASNATLNVSADATRVIAQPRSLTWPLYSFDSKTTEVDSILGQPDPFAGASIPPPPSDVGAVSPDGSLVIQGMSLRVYDGNLNSSFSLGSKYPYLAYPDGMAFSPDGGSFFLLTSDGQIVKFSTATWDAVDVYPVGAMPLNPMNYPTGAAVGYGDILQISPDGNHLSVITASGIQLIDLTKVVPVSTQGDDALSGSGSLYGLAGNDVLTGAGSTSMYGGAGDDTYYVVGADDRIYEAAGEGHDTVHSTAFYFSLDSNLEDLVLDGSGDISGSGNALDNVLTGNSGNNALSGGAGNDQISGGGGNDTLLGDSGNDVLDGGAGNDTARYYGASAGVSVSLAVAGPQDTGGDGTDTLISIENLTGSFYADQLTETDCQTSWTAAGAWIR